MEYITINFEVADRYLPSYCSVAAIKWENDEIEDVFETYLYPDCEIESFFNNRHNITNKMVEQAPKLYDVWTELSQFIGEGPAFFVNGSKDIDALMQRVAVDNLACPDMEYGSIISLFKRTWPDKKLDKYTLPNMLHALEIDSKSYDATQDAISMGIIIRKAKEKQKVSSIQDLFNVTGYACGVIISGRKYVCRAKKNNVRDYSARILLKIPFRTE